VYQSSYFHSNTTIEKSKQDMNSNKLKIVQEMTMLREDIGDYVNNLIFIQEAVDRITPDITMGKVLHDVITMYKRDLEKKNEELLRALMTHYIRGTNNITARMDDVRFMSDNELDDFICGSDQE
jgi:uncharacterized protein YfaT (DUF1175 family)